MDSDGRVFTRGAGGGEEARLVDLVGCLGPDGATRLAALLLAVPPPGLTGLDLRCTGACIGVDCIGVCVCVCIIDIDAGAHQSATTDRRRPRRRLRLG